MHLILAEDISGGLFAAGVFLGGLLASLLALCALVPAWQRNRQSTFILTAPALAFVAIISLLAAYEFVTAVMHDPDYEMGDFVLLWLLMAGLPFATGLLAIVVWWVRARIAATSSADAVNELGS